MDLEVKVARYIRLDPERDLSRCGKIQRGKRESRREPAVGAGVGVKGGLRCKTTPTVRYVTDRSYGRAFAYSCWRYSDTINRIRTLEIVDNERWGRSDDGVGVDVDVVNNDVLTIIGSAAEGRDLKPNYI